MLHAFASGLLAGLLLISATVFLTHFLADLAASAPPPGDGPAGASP
ncbi:hypothetical protein L6R50_19910 [Myxococcota bacterium]|nr:hypothetical protein [Myxococcota bacterium]